jgi:hypothetical protein
MLSVLAKQPSLVLTEEESEKLANAINRVAELYDTPFLDERSRAWINAAMVGAEVYGTRLAAVYFESKRRPHVVTPIKQATQPNAEAYTEGAVVNGEAL